MKGATTMDDRMLRVTVGYPRQRKKMAHIETPLGIINVYCGLQDNEGRDVVRVEVIPDKYAGEPAVTWDGGRLIRETHDEFVTRRLTDMVLDGWVNDANKGE
jgi:hypothetical protein